MAALGNVNRSLSARKCDVKRYCADHVVCMRDGAKRLKLCQDSIIRDSIISRLRSLKLRIDQIREHRMLAVGDVQLPL